MKIRHLLLGLMICVAGTGAIDLSGGYLDDQNTTQLTPFLIFGHVLYEGGAPCNSPNVSITNLNTGVAWCADTLSDSNCYQTLLTLADVSAGDVLKWSVTDGAVLDTTNHTVGQSDLESGGIFDFGVILQSIAPRIIGYAPESPVYDTGDATRRFNVTIDQVVDVTWLVNSSPAQTNWSMTDASYTHANVAVGVWNVSARASNGNGTSMQEWVWYVTKLPPPNITSFAPKLPVVRDTENMARTFGITVDQMVNVTWLINGSQVQANASVTDASYTNRGVGIGVRNVSTIVTNQNGTDSQEWTWYVTPYTPPPSPIFVIYGEVFYEDNAPVYAPCVVVTNLNTSREFVADNRSGENFYQIITDASEMQTGDLLMINAIKDGVLVGNGRVEHIVMLNESRSGAIGVDINQGWADLQVAEISTPPYIFDNATNTINTTIANNGTTDSDGFNVSLVMDGAVVDSAHIGLLGVGCSADVTFNWTPRRTGNHTLTVTVDSDGEIDESDEVNNATSVDVFVGVPDFTATGVTPDPEYCVIGDTIRIDTSVANVGAMDHTAVIEFYDNGSLNITRTKEDWGGLGESIYANDTITLPGALAIRVHFSHIQRYSHIKVYDKNDSMLVEILSPSNITDYWTDWILGDTLIIVGEVDTIFTIDGYQALIANETVHLNAGERRTVTASYQNVTQGDHDLFVAIDPYDTVPEYDETNNSLTALPVLVDGIDLEVVDDVDVPKDLFTDGIVDITANITNNGAVDADSFTVIFEDELGGNVTVFNETTVSSLRAGDSINVTAPWDLTGMDTSGENENCTHNMTVSILFDASPRSRYWPKDDINMENNILKLQNLNIMAKWDFSVENVTVAPSEVMEGGVVDITAIIGNYGHAGGNVSVGFYIDMWDNILGCDVVSLAYCDCLGAERGWSRDDVSNYTGQYIRIGTGDVWVDEGGTNATSLRWDAFTAAGNHTIVVVADPEERLDEGVNDTDIEKRLFGNNMKNCSLPITPPDLSITSFSLPGYADVGDMVNMTAVIENNEDLQANSTLWWVVEGNEFIHIEDLRSKEFPIHPQQGVSMMRVHFEYIYLRAYLADLNTEEPGTTIIDVLDMNNQSLYSNTLTGEDPCTTKNISDIWTKWGSGDTLNITTDILSEWNGEKYGMVEYKIDKYQVVIGNEMITLDASESCDAIWNATVLPGVYAAGVDVEDQNKSGIIILNGTELALTVSLNETYLDGDLVNIAAIITNLGTKNATDFTVNFSDHYNPGHGLCPGSTLGNTTHVPYLAAGASVSVPVPWNASIRNIVCDGEYQMCDGGWKDCDWTNEHIQDYTIEVTIDTLSNIEINETNNHTQTYVYVNPSRDFSVTNISFAVNDEPRNPLQLVADELVTLNATINITNLANRGGSVDVGVYCDDVLLNTTSVIFDTGNGTEYAVFEWLVDVGGNHAITVKVDPVHPRDKIVEFDESNNILHQEVHIIAPDLVVKSITLDPEMSEVGDVVNITAMVANIGQKNVSNVTVRFIDECRENASLITNRTISLNISENRSISVDWNTSIAGPHNISVIIDPENAIPELDESNNESTKFILVQGADLTVSNLTLTINGSDVTQIIEHGDRVNVTAEITNVGVRDAHNISVGFFIGVDQINKTGIDLSEGGSINISALWDTAPRDYIGNHMVRVFVDCDYAISETNESNNTLIEDVYVCTPEFSGNISWDPPNPLDGDEVTINAKITNSGCVPAEDFMVIWFYDYTPEKFCSPVDWIDYPSEWKNKNVYYDGAEWIYVYIAWHTDLDVDDVIITDKTGTDVRPDKLGFVPIRGDTVNVRALTMGGNAFEMYFYPDCACNLSKVENSLDTGQTTNVPLVKNVSSFNHTITVLIDPENNVPENNETDNAPSDVMCVTPTRDFTVTNVTAAETTNLTDTDTTRITATVANIGFRNGTTNVSFVDREEESRTYNYAFSKTISPPYAPISPQADRIIHRPGVDAIEVDLTYSIPVKTFGQISVCDGIGKTVWRDEGSEYGDESDSVIVYVEGDTALIYGSDFLTSLHGYTIYEFNHTEVTLNATETWNESRTLTSIWTASTGDHTLTVAADPDDETGEIDESNNTESILIHVNPSRDPAIVNLAHTPLHPMDGNDVTITAEVRNDGDKTANFTVDFWENTSKRYETDSQHISVPGASWVNIHLKCIREQRFVPDYECVQIDDIWLGGSIGDTLDTGTYTGGYPTVCGMITCKEDDWHDHVDRIRYMKLLNRTYVTLAPNETSNVTAIWEEMSIRDDPEYSVIVIVDPEDEIDEIDEDNNEMERQIVMDYPDLAIGNFESPTETMGARVTIKNTGIGGADNINVTFEMAKREDYSLTGARGYYTVRHKKEAHSRMEAAHIRVHFDYINIPDSGGNLKIAKSISSLRRGDVTETYRADVEDVWSPWVEDDKLVIDSFNAKSFRIDQYEWGDVREETIDHLGGGGGSDALEIKMEEWGWEYTEPMNLTVRVDPNGKIPEMDEENNNKTVPWCADRAADRIEFVSPAEDKLSLDAEKFVIDGYITNGGGYKDEIVDPVSDFNVTLEFRERYPNGTIGEVVFNTTKHVDEPFYAGQDMIRFEFDPDEELEVGGNYTVYLIADSSGDICESNDLYPEERDKYRLGESNNITSKNVYIYNSSGYTGGGELINVAQGEVHGRVVYTVGDSAYPKPLRLPGAGDSGTVRYTDVIPDTASDIKFARLSVYWFTYHQDPNRPGHYLPEIADVDVTFNGHSLTKAGNYSDNPGATKYDLGYGLYSYDVKEYITSDENVATVTSSAEWISGAHAIGLLVVYEDKDEPLTKYWINEGADVQWAKCDDDESTGLPYSECIAYAHFKDVESEDLDEVNATLLTILGTNTQYELCSEAGGVGDVLWLNDHQIGTPIAGKNQHYWDYLGDSYISVTRDRWEDVTDHLKKGDNEAAMGSRGNFIMPANAFLRLIFPPDLNVINLTTPASTVVGAHHSINTTIRNDGRSDAHDFNVTFYIDGNQMVRIPHLDLPAGENMTLHLYNWTPMTLMHVYNLTAAADVLSGEDWTEIETDNNAMTKSVIIEEGGFGNQTGPRGTGGGSNPTGGEYTEKVTGRVMQGIKEFLSGGGGGGAGMFSLTEWIMKGAVWLVLLLFVGLGYRMEQRSYGRVSEGYASSRV